MVPLQRTASSKSSRTPTRSSPGRATDPTPSRTRSPRVRPSVSPSPSPSLHADDRPLAVGTDQKAQAFLGELDSHPAIGKLVDVTSNYESEADEMKRKSGMDLTPYVLMPRPAMVCRAFG